MRYTINELSSMFSIWARFSGYSYGYFTNLKKEITQIPIPGLSQQPYEDFLYFYLIDNPTIHKLELGTCKNQKQLLVYLNTVSLKNLSKEIIDIAKTENAKQQLEIHSLKKDFLKQIYGWLVLNNSISKDTEQLYNDAINSIPVEKIEISNLLDDKGDRYDKGPFIRHLYNKISVKNSVQYQSADGKKIIINKPNSVNTKPEKMEWISQIFKFKNTNFDVSKVDTHLKDYRDHFTKKKS